MTGGDRYLLDTCAAIWISEGSRLEPEAIEAIDRATDAHELILLSPITAWERGLLMAKGKLASPLSAIDWFDGFAERPEIELAPLTPRILTDAWFLPEPLHRDPADRILVATARALRLTIITRDSGILDYAQRGHVRALRC
jgi:PIN domain nuclease of toxin-antitoxin system